MTVKKSIDRGFSDLCEELKTTNKLLERQIAAFEKLRMPLVAIAVFLAAMIFKPGNPFAEKPIPAPTIMDQDNTLTVEASPEEIAALASKEWLSTGEYAQLYGIHPDTVYNRIHSGTLVAHKEKGRYRIANPVSAEK